MARPGARTVLIAALATALLLLPAVALADTVSGYVTWTDTYGTDTPHRGYAATTTKCAVCHAVHKAPAGGEMLLPTTVAEACVYCHIDTATGLVRIYGGDATLYRTEDDRGHQSPAVSCVDCHSVHGANTFGGDKASKILKVWNIQQTFVEYLTGPSVDESAVINGVGPLSIDDGWPGLWENWSVQETAFCTQCHPYYSDAAETTVTAAMVLSDGSRDATTSFKTHPLKRPGGEQGNDFFKGFIAQGSTLPTSQIVASRGPRGCAGDCHTSPGDGTNGMNRGPGVWENSYPHYNLYTSRFLGGGPESWTDDPVADPSEDGACIRCHRWYNGDTGTTDGVGITY
jgi:predicted CXXCH cytochrome family protein